MEQLFNFLGFFTGSMLLGAMLFFSGLVAPMVFMKLDSGSAGKFIRSIFPHYYTCIIILSLISSGLLAPNSQAPSIMIGLVFLLGLISRQILMPRINSYRDAEIAGDERAKILFDRLHQLSVWINVSQLTLLIGALVVLVVASFQ